MSNIQPATEKTIQEAAAIIRAGGLVAFPTETVYGLGANAMDGEAVARIFAAKGRPATNPLIVHIAARDDLERIAQIDGANQARDLLIRHFWPGPLTLVLPKQSSVPDIVTAGGPTVAVRIPRHPVALALIQAAGVPIAAPSANRSEQLSPTLASHVAESLGNAVDLILDGGPSEVGLESTVLDLTEWPPCLLRPGMVSAEEIAQILGVSPSIGSQHKKPTSETVRSPGQSVRHYAPQTPLFLSDSPWEDAQHQTVATAILAWTEENARLLPNLVRTIILPAEPHAYAARLYEALHQLDHSGAARILVQSVPDTEEWLAVRDRLQRAATRKPQATEETVYVQSIRSS